MNSDAPDSLGLEARVRKLEAHVQLLNGVIEAVGWSVVAAALAVVLAVAHRGGGRLLSEVFNVAHVALSAGVALVGYRLSRKLLGQMFHFPRWVHLAIGLATVAVLGGGLEIAQRYVPGDPSWRDFMIDILGGLCGLLCIPAANLTTSYRRWVLRIAGVAIGIIGIWPSARAIYRHLEHDRRFPILAQFTDRQSPDIDLNGGATLRAVKPPPGFVTASNEVGELTLPAGEGYPGVEVSLPKGNWANYSELVLDIYVPGDEVVPISFRVHDQAHRNRFDDRFNADLALRPGLNAVRFAVSAIEQAPKGRKMSLDQVTTAILFASGRAKPTTLLLGEWRLEKRAEVPATEPERFRVTRRAPALRRGETFFDVKERFNRYYTDPSFAPLRTLHVSPNGSGDGQSAATPAAVGQALAKVQPGDLVQFAPGKYEACWELGKDRSGTYDAPIVLRGSTDDKGNLTTVLHCCQTGRRSCFNLEYGSYIAIDQFEFSGGKYGVRAAAGLSTSTHANGNAVLNSYGHDVAADPFFTGGNDWFVIEGNRAERGGTEDGHGIYLSNGSDFNIARYNDLNDNQSADFQVNADPILACKEHGVDYSDPRCDGDAKVGAGDGASDYFLIENNYFHNGRAQGANFTSLRSSTVRNNIFAFYQRHGVSFWQETPNPKLGASYNTICHNLFVGSNDHQLVQIIRHSSYNEVRNNVFLGVWLAGANVSLNTSTQLLAVSDTALHNVFSNNLYVGGMLVRMADDYTLLGMRRPEATELVRDEFRLDWFSAFPVDRLGSAEGFRPQASAPWSLAGPKLDKCSADFGGTERQRTVTLGPWSSASAERSQ